MRKYVLRFFYLIGRVLGRFIKLHKVKATILVLKSKVVWDVDAIAIFGRTAVDAKDIFDCAAKIYKKGAKKVIINGIESKRLDLSYSAWKQVLNDKGIDCVESFKESTNTASEAVAIIDMAKKNGWKTLTLLAHGHQILRCLRAIVKAMENANYELRVYCVSPEPNWFEITPGSQNLNKMERIQHVVLEYSLVVGILSFLKLVPPIASTKDVVDYFRRRENISI